MRLGKIVLLSALMMIIMSACITSPEHESATVVINAFDLNPHGNDAGREWVTLYNPSDTSVNISGWTLSTTHGKTVTVKIENATIPPHGYWTYIHHSQWLDNNDESIILKDENGVEVDRTPVKSDNDNDNRFWKRHTDGFDTDSEADWIFTLLDLEKSRVRRGKVIHVEDGDTIDISPVDVAGVQRIRLVCLDAPEKYTERGRNATEFLKSVLCASDTDLTKSLNCSGKEVEFDVDDLRQYDRYNRILAVVYVNETNVNALLLNEGFADPLIMPPSEFVPKASFVYSPECPVVGQNITFNASSSYTLDPDATIVSYMWDFGDGEKGSGKTVNHSYSSAGSYNVTLSVTDSDGEKKRTNTVNLTIKVRPAGTEFDTRESSNPYPSISGKFVGTIKTNTKIIATKLHTYPCEGTGGHTEHAIICNKTWCAEASWSGYEGDWMNIYFNKTVVLMPYESYNITIVTGSYPQIHHVKSVRTENGWINCTYFEDVNGRGYDNWIPAIKLW